MTQFTANEIKENAVSDYMEMIHGSWTWARLSDYECKRFEGSIEWAQSQGVIIGTYRQRWMICEAMYKAFLGALGYQPMRWRGM